MIDAVLGSVEAGRRIVGSSWIGTGVVVVGSVVATVVLGPIRYVAVGVDLALFVLGIAVFFWAYAVAVGRSRDVEIGIGGLFFLAGRDTAPRYARLSPADRQAILEILRDTKKDLPDYFR